ncbi:MAG TPA: hypothetical protein VFU86_02200, partial [Terriglobales bacterium]|nr:hypothetical protein [Terriglobales bacterium]
GLIAVAGLTAIFLGKSPALLLPINSALAVCVVLVLLTVSAFPSLSGMPSSSRNGTHGLVQEVTNEPHPQLVWQMQITNQNSYRANRIPSLYPGVQW